MHPTTVSTTTVKPHLPSIKFLLNSSVEMFDDQLISVEHRNLNYTPRKLSVNIPSPKCHLISPVERSIDCNMSGYHHKGNHYQNNLPRLPSISTIGHIEPVNRDTIQKHSRPNSIQSLLSPPESPDMTNNPSFNDYETHHNQVVAEQQQQQPQQQQQQQQRPKLVHPQHAELHYSAKTVSPVYPSNAAPLLAPHYHQSYVPQSYVHQESHRAYDRVGDYHQERVVYDRSYEQHRAYPSSNTSPTTLQPTFSPFESRPTTTLPRLEVPPPMINGGITRRFSTPITTKIMNDQLTSPIPGGPSSNNNNRYQCPYCSKRFSRPSSLRIHTYSHTGEKPFVCTEPGCGRKFSVQSNMRRHLRVHRLGRPVKKVRYDGEVEGVKMLNHGAVNHGAVMRNC